MAGQNTMLGDAIGLAIRSFEASAVEARVLILLSDGTDTGSRMAPAKAAAIAAQNGVVIHTIAVGDPDAAPTRTRSTSPPSRRSPAPPAAASTAPRTRPASPQIYAQIDAARRPRGRDHLLAPAHPARRAARRRLRRARRSLGYAGRARRGPPAPPPSARPPA